MLTRLVAGAYGAWLLLILLAFYWGGPKNLNALQFAVMAGCVPMGLQLLLLGFDSRGQSFATKLSLLLVLVILLSYLANTNGIADWTPVIHSVNVIFLLAIAIVSSGCPDRDLLPASAAAYALFTAAFLIPINLSGHYVWGRLSAGFQPNFWGLIGLSVATSALGFRRWRYALPPLAIGLWTMYNASSRSAMLGVAVAALPILVRSTRELRGARLYAALCGIAACALLAIFFWTRLSDMFGVLVGNDVLKLSDPERGLGTGFSGRTGIWDSVLNLWMHHPLLGVGFRETEQILDYPAHNGYLAILSDTGIFGFLLYLTLMVSAFRGGWNTRDAAASRLILGTITAYAIMSFFEARAINTGNPFGFLMVMISFLALNLQSRSSAAKAELGAAGVTLEGAHRA